MPSASAFVARAQELTEGTPYAVTATPEGCDIGVAINDAQWWGVLSRQGLQRSFVHHVALDETSGVMRVTDDSRTVSWQAGADGEMQPHLAGEASTTKGRVFEKSFGAEYGWGDDGSFGKQADLSFDSREGRNLINAVAKEQGWSEGLSGEQKIGVYVALGAVGLVVVIAVIAVLVLLLG